MRQWRQTPGALHSTDAERRNWCGKRCPTTSQQSDGANNRWTGLAELRLETAERLSSAGLSLDWIVEDKQSEPISAVAAHTLRSILREAVSNVIRHAEARRVTIAINRQNDCLSLEVTDDGRGLPAEGNAAGIGLVSMRNRLAALGGTLDVADAMPGLRLVAQFTCAGDPAS